MGKSTASNRIFQLTKNWSALIALSAVSVATIQPRSSARQTLKTQDVRITVRYTDVRQSAGTDTYKPPHPLRSALYHNNGDGTFTDVTEKAGVGGEGHYGQGVAVGDYDNDGYPDLYVTGYGRAILYHK